MQGVERAASTPAAQMPPPSLRRATGKDARLRDAPVNRRPHAGDAISATGATGWQVGGSVRIEPVLAATDAGNPTATPSGPPPGVTDGPDLQLAEAAYRQGVDLS
jgi:hypothetical protein